MTVEKFTEHYDERGNIPAHNRLSSYIYYFLSLSLSASLAASAPIGQSSANKREFAVFSLVYIGYVCGNVLHIFCMNTA